MPLSSWISFVTVQFQIVVVHICGKELLDDRHSYAGGFWVATGLSRCMGCSDSQGSGRGRESINPAKMKLCPVCHNPFTSSKLYKLLAVFFAFGWLLIWYSWDPICRGVAFEFLCSPEVICGNTGKDVLFLQNKRKLAAARKPKHKNTQTNNKTRKPNHKYTNKTIKT